MLESQTYKGFTIEIHHDDGYGSHPRKEYDTLSTIASWDTSQLIDNECVNKPSYEELFPKGEEDEDYQMLHSEVDLFEMRNKYYLFNVRMVAILPIYTYHNGYSVNGSPRYQIGFIYMTKKTWEENFDQSWLDTYHHGKTPKEVAEIILKGDVESLDCFARGEIYGYRINETEDSCWGFYGDYEKSGLLDEARSTIDYHISVQKKKHFSRLKSWIKNNVNLKYRYGLSFN